MKDEIDEKILILGASSIPLKHYQFLAANINCNVIKGDTKTVILSSNPNHTKAFIESINDNKNRDKLIFERAIKCIDKAEFVVVDISEPSIGMGMEVFYLLSHNNNKEICFIAQENKKISPHISGMYQIINNKSFDVEFYKDEKDAVVAVKRSESYKNFAKKIQEF